MPELINHNSFVLMALALLVALALRLRQDGFSWRDGAILAAAAAALAGLWVLLRPGESDYAEVQAVEARLGQGRPVLVEIYSNY